MFLCWFKEGICAGDTDAALWELGHLRVFQDLKQQPKDPCASNVCLSIIAVHTGGHSKLQYVGHPVVWGHK